MEANFWHQKWERGEIGFHESQVNPLLVAHIAKLNLGKGARIFLPLCGKTLDIAWLLNRGYRVVGAELSALAINALFNDLGVQPTIVTTGTLEHYSVNNLDIFVGDIFALSPAELGVVNAVYDRAALVALPAAIRHVYAAHILRLTHEAPQLLISYEYDQSLMNGPPFSVTQDEIRQLFKASYNVQSVERRQVANGLRGTLPAMEIVWLLQ